ncbi:uncharacterized protein T551_03449 [Pneumocystis jirovecii RU7]|uniref:Ribosome assembly protein 3 n=1 Tax=Pneumocystis jirovecii (strain RU7) TaxID=1408657 RepID=A0A0W4ZDQ1_PNEJ7|nr:uncharacterized protein T551_03449 [Pneumocystis jirovecii RU7]KTW26532.1 hypothetical protein T551_03449 [Pneumocystis jirovecii RU7]
MEKKRKKSADKNTDLLSSYTSVLSASENVSFSIPPEQVTSDNKKDDFLYMNNEATDNIRLDTSEDLFEQHYMNTLTQEFENELDELRKSPSFDPQSMPILVAALKKGVNIFSAEEKQKVLDNLMREKDKGNKGNMKNDA